MYFLLNQITSLVLSVGRKSKEGRYLLFLGCDKKFNLSKVGLFQVNLILVSFQHNCILSITNLKSWAQNVMRHFVTGTLMALEIFVHYYWNRFHRLVEVNGGQQL